MRSFWITLQVWVWRIRRALHLPAAYFAPGFEGYGGATITRRVDGAGAEWIACCARSQADGYFGFYAFRNGVNVPLSPRVSGRGTIHDDGVWIAWEGSAKHQGQLPGWTPKSAGAGHAVAIPPGGALGQLYVGVYVAADFDTPQETATRVQKQLDAIQELTELLKQAGVLV